MVELPLLSLQVLLSQSHRFRALVLLGRFLDMGAWAVDLVTIISSAMIIDILLYASYDWWRNMLHESISLLLNCYINVRTLICFSLSTR